MGTVRILGVEVEDSGEEEDLVVVVMMDTQDLLHHTPDSRIALRPHQHRAGDQVSGQARWAVLRLGISLGDEIRDTIHLLPVDARQRLQDSRAFMTLEKAVLGFARHLDSRLPLQALVLGQQGGGDGRHMT